MEDFFPDALLADLKNLVNKKSGILIKGLKLECLRGRAIDRCMQLSATPEEFISRLSGNQHELGNLVSGLVNQETYFFRDRAQLAAFSSLLKEVAARKGGAGDRYLKVLSAGCAAGEEPYSLNILITESGLFAGWNVNVVGVDISRFSIARAREAVYRENSVRLAQSEAPLKEKYFNRMEGGRLALKPQWKNNVSFRTGNLMDEGTFDGLANLDFIFCRNIFIYMQPQAVKTITAHFRRCISPKGCLFAGCSDLMDEVLTGFRPVRTRGGLYYRMG
ncbi:MAG: hypothetical protein M0Z52_07870 [Actinomycetota bacterium]|nr:hypothetical protein [Actinomycetota bacterium]